MNQLLANNLPDRTAEQISKDNTNKDPKQKKVPKIKKKESKGDMEIHKTTRNNRNRMISRPQRGCTRRCIVA